MLIYSSEGFTFCSTIFCDYFPRPKSLQMLQLRVPFSCPKGVSTCLLKTGFSTDCPGCCPPPQVSGYLPEPFNPTFHLGNSFLNPHICKGPLQMAMHLGLPSPWVTGPGFGLPYLADSPGTSSSSSTEL